MYIILCIDERGGRTFMKRRQSQDRVLRERVLSLAAGHTLWMDTYSAKQFIEGGAITVDDHYREKAGLGDYCFVELGDIDLRNCEGIVLYNWNRHYPSDVKWTADLAANGFMLTAQTDFAGHSHEKITEQIYMKG